MQMPHDDILARLECWCMKNWFIRLCKFVLQIMCGDVYEKPTMRKSGYRFFNNLKLQIVEGIILTDMPRGTMGEIDTFRYKIRRNRNKLYLNPNAKLNKSSMGNNTVMVGRLFNGNFVISCLKNNLPIFKNTWFVGGFRITKIKYGKFIRIEQAKKEKEEKSAARKLRAQKKLAIEKAEIARIQIVKFNNQYRPNQYRPNQYPNRYHNVKNRW